MSRFGLLVVGLAACSGGEEKSCDAGFPVVVTVSDPDGAPMDDATVTILDSATGEKVGDCASQGGGEYECLAPEPGAYKVYAQKTSFEARGQEVEIPEDADCSAPVVTVDFLLARESGV